MSIPHHNDDGHVDDGHGECGSLWTPYSYDTPDDWADDLGDEFAPEPPRPVRADARSGAESRADRLRDAWYRFGELLVAHGVDPVDVHLLMPRWRGLRVALARELDRERDAALTADPAMCQQVWPVCPEHGDTLHWRWGQTRCRARGCRRRWSEDWLIRHCDQPAVALVTYPATATADGGAEVTDVSNPDEVGQFRLCRGHLAADPGAVVVRTLVTTPDERGDSSGPDTRARAA